jgi:hypothetical protein
VTLDEVALDAVVPPPRPSTVPQALQQTMPLADVLNLIAKPPGSAPPFIPYKPVGALLTITAQAEQLRPADVRIQGQGLCWSYIVAFPPHMRYTASEVKVVL